MNSDPDPTSSPSHPQQHLGRSQLNAAPVDHGANSQRPGTFSADSATSSVPGHSRGREKTEKKGEYGSNSHAKSACIKHWEIVVCLCILNSV